MTDGVDYIPMPWWRIFLIQFLNIAGLGPIFGAVMRLTFIGKAVGICIVSGPDAGIIEYGIDNQPFHKVDLFTIWSKNYNLPWYLILGDQLSDRKHILEIRTSSDKNPESVGNVCLIVHFLINK
jgi:sialidase-1